MVSALGINTTLVYAGVFALGSLLAGLGGALAAFGPVVLLGAVGAVGAILMIRRPYWGVLLLAATLPLENATVFSGFTAAREVVFEMFQRSAELYEKALPEMEQAKRTTEVYDRWFYTALGSVDIGRISPGPVGSNFTQDSIVKGPSILLDG